MNRFLYTVLLSLTLPFVPLKLMWRGLKQPEYLHHWAERFGFYKAAVNKPIICIHCVSVGETRAAAPLIKALQLAYPQHQILITHATPTGRDTSTALFGDSVLRAYLPYDVPFAVNRFIKHFNPALVLLMETELWFNLINQCHAANIPTLLVNARLSEKSAKGYGKIQQLTATGLQQLSAIAAQTEGDAKRFEQFGVTPSVSGNIKFDVKVPAQALSQAKVLESLFGEKRFIFVSASTRDGEEALILDMVQQLNHPSLLTVIVPRHPQRFDEVANLIKARGINMQRRSALNSEASADTQVILGDSMGELFSYYAASDVAFVGGSLLPFGGQNLIEPCAVGTPVLIGPHTFNFELITKEAIEAGAVIRVADVNALTTHLTHLMNNDTKRTAMEKACFAFVADKTGATAKTMAEIKRFI